jgi:FlaA1/EpsC-like NDP-sugar epimerase
MVQSGRGKLGRGADCMRFTGKVVLVAGGSGGLGKSVSLAFLEEQAG